MENTTLVNTLVYNNRFDRSRKLTAEQIGAEQFDQWRALMDTLRKACYAVYCVCENNDLRAEDASVDKTAVFDALRDVLAYIGKVKGHKMYANDDIVLNLIGYSGKRANVDAPELALCKQQIKHANDDLESYRALNVTDAKYKAERIAAMEQGISDLEEQKSTLEATPDMRTTKPTRTNEAFFRSDVEHRIARAIEGQLAKTNEQLDAEEAARKADRAARAKARKAAKNATK